MNRDVYPSSTAASSSAHAGGRDGEPMEAIHPNPGLHSAKESSVDTCKAPCVFVHPVPRSGA